jgi:Zn finger protein HypA/HybF involved in hydrogenase expression
MSVQNNTSVHPFASILCADCGSPMRLVAVVPLQSARRTERTDEIAYRCEACRSDTKQLAKPRVY